MLIRDSTSINFSKFSKRYIYLLTPGSTWLSIFTTVSGRYTYSGRYVNWISIICPVGTFIPVGTTIQDLRVGNRPKHSCISFQTLFQSKPISYHPKSKCMNFYENKPYLEDGWLTSSLKQSTLHKVQKNPSEMELVENVKPGKYFSQPELEVTQHNQVSLTHNKPR